MTQDTFPSKLLENAVTEFAKLPGIGKKTALRLVLHLLKQDKEDVHRFSNSITRLRDEIRHCKVCRNISDTEVCNICSNESRDHGTICVVENIRDVMSIENTQQYHGVFHVLGGIISPMDGIGPADLEIDSLIKRVGEGDVKEIILALSTTMEGDSTNFYIFKKLKESGVKVSMLARGVSIGDELEYIDEVTLGRSIINRQLFEQSLGQ
ncbi:MULTISPECIES: recombination mediator RecR [Prolixibacter]|uniref:Recombination protein RecR n=1 Tax=Prolixibacter denitrificans TaxID=1541063 RepID=A0A2P8CK61_9BACT|nr:MULTISPECIES: recombination mediator RecR [Prolixibacter]PSK85359.1 DNA replication and repair protein RecR [Prolixibacter denitrificans]GET19978.1 recombination protein RecR [Prolixibacter denitrificans]GET26655.1 recombination protein RecR [Prolixibacter sp. NT017]